MKTDEGGHFAAEFPVCALREPYIRGTAFRLTECYGCLFCDIVPILLSDVSGIMASVPECLS